MPDVTLSAHRFLVLIESTAYHGAELAVSLGDTDRARFHPGDDVGDVLCDAELAGPHFADRAMTSFMEGLIDVCAQKHLQTPSLQAVLAGLPLAINNKKYPTVDVQAMVGRLAATVPAIYGRAI